MIFQTFLLKQIISTYSLIKKRMGGNGPAHGTQRSGPWYSKVRPMSPLRLPRRGREIKRGLLLLSVILTTGVKGDYNWWKRVSLLVYVIYKPNLYPIVILVQAFLILSSPPASNSLFHCRNTLVSPIW